MPSNVQLFLGNQPITNYLGVNDTEFYFGAEIPRANMIFWLEPSTMITGSATWVSNYGLGVSGSFTGVTPVQKNSSNAVNFTTSSAMRFGGNVSLDYRAEDFTIIVATRYSGSASDRHGRLLDGINNNWLAGTYGGGGGGGDTEYWAAYYNTAQFVILSGSIYDTNWRISTIVRDKTNLSSSFYINSVLAASASNNSTTNGFNGLAINNGQAASGNVNPGTGEVTQGDVGDIILYNRVLQQDEITYIYNILKNKYSL